MTKEQLRSRLEAIRDEVRAITRDKGVWGGTGLYACLNSADFMLLQSTIYIGDYDEDYGNTEGHIA